MVFSTDRILQTYNLVLLCDKQTVVCFCQPTRLKSDACFERGKNLEICVDAVCKVSKDIHAVLSSNKRCISAHISILVLLGRGNTS